MPEKKSDRLALAVLILLLGVCSQAADAHTVVQIYGGSVTPVDGFPSGISAAALGDSHILALRGDALYGWGENFFGQLGLGYWDDGFYSSAVPIPGMDSGVTAIAPGYWHSVAIKNSAAYEWGLGTDALLQPTPVSGLTSGVTAVAVGGYDGGAILNYAIRDGALYGWGYNDLLGGATLTTPATGLESGVTAISAGDAHSLAIKDGALYGWGNRTSLMPFNGGPDLIDTPILIDGFLSGVTEIATGAGFSVVLQNGTLKAFGDFRSIGINSGVFHGPIELFSEPPPTTFVDIEAGYGSAFALAADGSIWELSLGPFFEPRQFLPPEGFVFTAIDMEPMSQRDKGVLAILTPVPEPNACTLALLAFVSIVAVAHGRARLAKCANPESAFEWN